jgi:hypothetical protein
MELPSRRAQQDVSGLLGDAARRTPEPMRREQGRSEGRTEGFRRPPAGRNGHQATNYQR